MNEITNFNDKTQFKFIKNLLKIKNDTITTSYNEYEKYFYSNNVLKEIDIYSQDKFKRLCYAWTLKENFDFRYESLKYLLKVITGTNEPMINPLFLEELLAHLQELKREFSIAHIKELFVGILRYNSFYEYSYETVSYLINFIFYQHNQPILVFYMYFNKLYEYIMEDSIDKAYSLIDLLLVENAKYHIKTVKKPIELVINALKVIKQEYINAGIENIYLYGSYAKNTINDFSDIDVFIEITDRYHVNMTQLIKKKLSKLLKVPVIDISLSTEIDKKYREEIFNHAIKI